LRQAILKGKLKPGQKIVMAKGKGTKVWDTDGKVYLDFIAGIAVLNGVVLMSRLLALEEEGKGPAEAAMSAARERARPVLMTALVAALGFVPMMLATGVGAEVQRPLATVVVGGLLTSTILTLVVLPSLYPVLSKLGPRGEADEGREA